MYTSKQIRGYTLAAKNGEIGKVRDCLFDDVDWHIRYLVVDTGNWLIGRKIVLSPESLSAPDTDNGTVPASLTREAVQDSPSLEEHQPVSLQFEERLATYYQWPVYWDSMTMAAGIPGAGVPPTEQPPQSEDRLRVDSPDSLYEANPHLRSAAEVSDYRMEGEDGTLGHLEDVLFDAHWKIHYWVVDAGSWLGGRMILVDPRWATSLDWSRQTVKTRLSRRDVADSPEYEPDSPWTGQFGTRLREYFQRILGPSQ